MQALGKRTALSRILALFKDADFGKSMAIAIGRSCDFPHRQRSDKLMGTGGDCSNVVKGCGDRADGKRLAATR
jgi:hypothetical protein